MMRATRRGKREERQKRKRNRGRPPHSISRKSSLQKRNIISKMEAFFQNREKITCVLLLSPLPCVCVCVLARCCVCVFPYDKGGGEEKKTCIFMTTIHLLSSSQGKKEKEKKPLPPMMFTIVSPVWKGKADDGF